MQAPETGDTHPFRGVGETLFSALFQGQVLRLFTGIYDQSTRQSDSYLRIRLDIDERAPEIADLPWEFLYWQRAPLATQVQTLLVRQWLNMDYGPIAPLAIVGQPKVLLVIPAGSGLMTDREREIVADTLQRAGIPYQDSWKTPSRCSGSRMRWPVVSSTSFTSLAMARPPEPKMVPSAASLRVQRQVGTAGEQHRD